MSHFVTDISQIRHACVATRARAVFDGRVRVARPYRLRLAALRERAPDTLFARVRRALREADAAMTRSE
jgi:hypothetical protein